MMSACDFALEKLWAKPELFEKYVLRLREFRREIIGASGAFQLVERDDIDAGKLLFRTPFVAEEFTKIFAREYKVQLEMATGRHLLAMTSVADTDEGFARLKAAIVEVKNAPNAPSASENPHVILPEIVLSPREAMQRESEKIPLEAAVGRISAELIADYPPGIAILAPGERICKRVHARLAKLHIRVCAHHI